MAYFSQERKTQIAPAVKNILNKYGIKGSLSVRNHRTVVLTLTGGKIDFVGNHKDVMGRNHADYFARSADWGDIDVNVYHYRNHFDGVAREALSELISALNDGNWDRSEIEYDYHDRGWYVDVQLGRWNRPYTVTA
jgi:hypothetical protein